MKNKFIRFLLPLIVLFTVGLPSVVAPQAAIATNVITVVGSGNPNSAVGGKVGQAYFDSTNVVDYICTTAGNSSTAVWTRRSVPAGTVNWLASGSAIPAGWVLCNGTLQSGVTPPNLIGMFVQGCNYTGLTGGGNSSGFDTGGTVTPGTSVGVVSNNLSHSHTVSVSPTATGSTSMTAGGIGGILTTSSTFTASSGSSLGSATTQAAAVALIPVMKL